MRPCSKQEAYAAVITYGTNNEFGFDCCVTTLYTPVSLKGYHYAIVDEIDSILIDEARTPLIISAPSGAAENLRFCGNCRKIKEGDHYTRRKTQSGADYRRRHCWCGKYLYRKESNMFTTPGSGARSSSLCDKVCCPQWERIVDNLRASSTGPSLVGGTPSGNRGKRGGKNPAGIPHFCVHYLSKLFSALWQDCGYDGHCGNFKRRIL